MREIEVLTKKVDDLTRKMNYLVKAVAGSTVTEKKEFEIVLALSCEYFGMTIEKMLSTRRDIDTARSRSFLYLILREELGMTLQTIAEKLNRGHSTVLQMNRRIKEEMELSTSLREKYEKYKNFVLS